MDSRETEKREEIDGENAAQEKDFAEEQLTVMPPSEYKEYPDGGWGWVVALASAGTHFLVPGFARSFGLIYLVLLDKFEQSAAATGLVVSAFNSVRQMLGPVAGILVDRFTCRWVVMTGGLLVCCGCIISAFATSLLYLYISFCCLAGLGASMIFTPSYIIVGQYFHKKKGKAMGIATLGSGLGTVVMAPIITLLLHHYSFFGTMFIMAALQLNNCVLGALFRPLSQWKGKQRRKERAQEMQTLGIFANVQLQHKSSQSEGKKSPDETLTEKEPNVLPSNMDTTSSVSNSYIGLNEKDLAQKDDSKPKSACGCDMAEKLTVLFNVTFLLYGLQIVTMSLCIQVFLTFLPSLSLENGATDYQASLILSLFGVADICGRFSWGFIFDLKSIRSRRRLLHTMLGLFMGIFTLLTAFMYDYPGVVVMTLLYGVVEGGFHSQRATIISEFVPKEHMSSTVGFVISFQGVGNLLGPPVAGAFRDITGSYMVCYYFAGSAFILTSLLFIAAYFCCKKKTES